MKRAFGLVVASLALLCAGSQSADAAGTYRGTTQDFMEISQLFSSYNYAIDNKDGEAWADNFTSDGVFQDPSWCAIGREKLIEVVGRTPQLGADEKQHHVHSLGPIVYQDRNHATVRSTVMVVRETGFGIVGGIGVTGVYEDKLVRQHGRWLFAFRLVHRPTATAPVPCPPPR